MAIALGARLDVRARVKPLTPARFWAVCDALDGDLSRAASSDIPEVRDLAGRTTAAALHAAEFEAQGLTLVTPFHRHYPTRYLERLRTNAPPLLYIAGDPSLLASSERPRLAVVGSRDASETELDSAREASGEAASRTWDIVSGGAKGVDAVALNAAAASGALVIAILTEGLRRAMRKGALRRLVADGQAVLAAPVHPDTGFNVGTAMSRNKLIYALGNPTYVAAVVEGKGGTWNGAVEALRRGYGNVAVNAHAEAAGALADHGARIVHSMDELFDLDEAVPADAIRGANTGVMQTNLFD